MMTLATAALGMCLLAAPSGAASSGASSSWAASSNVPSPGPSFAQEVPPTAGFVTDLGGILSEAKKRELEALMESFRKGSGHEIAVLTVPTLGNGAIEEFSLRVAREWGLGQADSHNGALLVIAVADRKLRIEVGRGLEGNITDAISGRILRGILAPAFRTGRFDEGVDAAVRALHAAAGGDYGPLEQAEQSDDSGGLVTVIVVVLFSLIVLHNRRRGAAHWTGGRGGFGPIIIGGPGRFGGGGGGSSGGFGGFGGGGGFSGGGASGGW